jgi:hypothetical protein
VLNLTTHRFEELDTNLGTRGIIFDKQNDRLSGPPDSITLSGRGWCGVVDVGDLRNLLLLIWHGSRIHIGRHCIGDLVDMVRVERINPDRLSHGIDGIAGDVVHGIAHHGHRGRCDHGTRVSRRAICILKAFELTVGHGIGVDAGEQFARPAQLRAWLICVGRLPIGCHGLAQDWRRGRRGCGGLTVIGCEVVDDLVGCLLLSIENFLQGQDLIDQNLVRLRNFAVKLLQLLDLLLGRRKLFGDDADVVVGGEIVGRLRLPRGRSLSPDVIQVIFTVDSEVRVLEFQDIPKWGRVLVVAGRLDLVEVIFVELPDEAGHVAVLEVLGKYRPRELFTLHKVLTR